MDNHFNNDFATHKSNSIYQVALEKEASTALVHINTHKFFRPKVQMQVKFEYKECWYHNPGLASLSIISLIILLVHLKLKSIL